MATIRAGPCRESKTDEANVSREGGRRGCPSFGRSSGTTVGRSVRTYTLFGLENALATVQPFALGLAIDGLIGRSYRGLAVFAALEMGHLFIGMSLVSLRHADVQPDSRRAGHAGW